VSRSQLLDEVFVSNLLLELMKQTAIMAECAIFTYHENPRWRQPPYCISKNVNMSGLVENISTKFVGQMHHGHGHVALSTTARRLSAYLYLIALATSTTST